jgi:hypothetical protein
MTRCTPHAPRIALFAIGALLILVLTTGARWPSHEPLAEHIIEAESACPGNFEHHRDPDPQAPLDNLHHDLETTRPNPRDRHALDRPDRATKSTLESPTTFATITGSLCPSRVRSLCPSLDTYWVPGT